MRNSDSTLSTGPALEALSEWANHLKDFQHRLGRHFARSEARQAAFDYLQALLSPVERKNGWQMAEQVGHANPYRLQHLLGRANWDADEFSRTSRTYVHEQFGCEDFILGVDETGFIKQGEHSVGVQVQYCGRTGGMENCQVGVFLSYISPKGHCLIDRRLYLPQSWSSDQARRTKADVPESVEFATKPQLARAMLADAFAHGLRPKWVVGDEVYGGDGKFWWWLETEHQQAYVLNVAVKHMFWLGYKQYRADAIVKTVRPEEWRRLSCGDGSKGERLYDWARIEVNSMCDEYGYGRWLLFRRNLENPEDPRSITYYVVHAPQDSSLEQMVEAAGSRWRVEECIKVGKSQLGMSDYETRSWQGWHHPSGWQDGT
jgi:SRSO17 transposase